MEKQGSNFFEFDGAKGIAATITLHEDILKDLKKYSSWGRTWQCRGQYQFIRANRLKG